MGILKRLQQEIDEREKHEGVTLAELLDLSPPLRRLMNRVTRYGELTVAQAAEMLEETPENTAKMLNKLVDNGFLLREQRAEGWVYQVHLARKRGTSLPADLWTPLAEQIESPEAEASDSEGAPPALDTFRHIGEIQREKPQDP